MANEHKMTEAELLSAEIDLLTDAELSRRSLLINLKKAERELEYTTNENEKYQEKKVELARMRKLAKENAEAERRKTEMEQAGCAHKTGGEGLMGFFSGDGSIYGSSTAGLELPTGEVYYLCFRCQKEWHRPSKRKVIDGEISLERYYQMEREYIEVARWPRKSFSPWNGELCAASKFNIPKLQMQIAQDNADFEAFLAKQRVAV